MIDFFEFQLRTRIMFKAGLARDLAGEIRQLGGTRAFIVADPGISALLAPIIDGFASSVEIVGIFTDVPANSSVPVVEQAAAQARAGAADLLITVGGGSAIDTAKAIRILLSEGGTLHDYEGYNLLERPLIPLIAIPTTAGTGSEVTAWAVIRDPVARQKLAFGSPFLAPDFAILDPELTRSLPPHLTAATGMDALTHAIEAFVGSNTNPLTDTLSLQAIDMIANNLRAATYSGDDLDARGAMLIASCIAGLSFSGSGGSLGIVHALAHAIGGSFDLHHGTLNAILLPHGMAFNAGVAPNRFARIARTLGVNAGGRDEQSVIDDGIAAVRAIAEDCRLPLRLRDIELPETALPAIAEIAISDAAIFTNPRTATYEETLALLHTAW
ncbi:MAG TPA: iron-containing alcohol dehydrogenase [Roseiflexaceae bacterium]|nr:iron-containing alcohol dehydrogenase [Roseiflexaceae bacterium]HMP39813.1 iron-containing alcohol dehydrogenase [Roseiflexaceae bacterium]